MTSTIPIVCPYCGVGCNLELALDENGRPVKTSAAGLNPELNAKKKGGIENEEHVVFSGPDRLHADRSSRLLRR